MWLVSKPKNQNEPSLLLRIGLKKKNPAAIFASVLFFFGLAAANPNSFSP